MNMAPNTAIIGDIGRHAVHDGPGIRTTVFFKGCPLHCPWCHNPELIEPTPEIAYHPHRCIGCGDCRKVCPEEAVTWGGHGRIDRDRCTGCGLCAQACPALAIQIVGRRYTVPELTEILLRDRRFYETSGGGVTLSGGEPGLHLEFVGPLLKSLGAEGIHTAIQTAGIFPWKEFEAGCLQSVDLILYDLKIADPALHRRIIGGEPSLILENLARIMAARPDALVVRIPLIPGYTATADNLAALARILGDMGVRRCSVLSYHPMGRSKAESVGRTWDPGLPDTPMGRKERNIWKGFFEDFEMVDF